MEQSRGPIKRALWGVAIIGMAAVAYWAYSIYSSTGASAPQTGVGPAVEVAVMTLKSQTVRLYKELPGRTNAFKVADIRPQVSGIITKRLFEEGRTVTKGQQLYQIDPAPYKAVYDSAFAILGRAKTNVKLVQSKVNRYTKLVKTRDVSQQAYEDVVASLDQAVADVAVAEATVAAAQVNLNYTRVSAPISGRIGRSSVTPGALVTANQVDILATITQLDPIYADLTLSSRDLMRLRPQFENGKKVKVSLYDEDGQSAYNHEGELQFSEVTVDQTTGTILLRALFPNPGKFLLPGMFVRAKIHLQPKQVMLVPQSAAVRGANGKLSVWVVGANDVVQPTPIEANRAVNNNWIVESGVKDGATIVTKGFQKIRPGVTVKPVFETPLPAQQTNKAE